MSKELYAIGIITKEGKIKFVTSLEEHHFAKWEDGKEALLFSKKFAKDMCKGFAWNGIIAITVIKEDYLDLKNYRNDIKKPSYVRISEIASHALHWIEEEYYDFKQFEANWDLCFTEDELIYFGLDGQI